MKVGRKPLCSDAERAAIVDEYRAFRERPDIRKKEKSRHPLIFCEELRLSGRLRFELGHETLKRWDRELRRAEVSAKFASDPLAVGKFAEQAGKAVAAAAERAGELKAIMLAQGLVDIEPARTRQGKVPTARLLEESRRVTWDLLQAAKRKATDPSVDGRQLAELLEQVVQTVATLDTLSLGDDDETPGEGGGGGGRAETPSPEKITKQLAGRNEDE